MADRSIIVRLMAEVGGFVSGMGKARRASEELGQSTQETGKAQESAFQKMTRSARENEAAWTSAGMKMTAAGAGIGLALAGTVREAMRWETAFTGVRKTVDGTPEQLAAVEQGLRQLARELPATHTQIAAVAEAAGQLGVSTDGISEFTRTMVMLGESTNLTAETAALQLARFGSIMGTTEQDIGRVASSLVGLGNNFAATESEIAGMSLRLAAAGRQAGLTEAEVMGLAAAALSVGVNVEAGGTALSTTIMRIGQAVDQGGTKLELFGHVADMTGEQFARAWRDDATSALTTFIQGLETAEERGMTMNGALADLGITAIREGGTLRSLAFASEDLAAAVATSSAAFTEGNALVDEFGNFLGTTASQVALAQNSLRDAAIDIGSVFLPVVAQVAGAVADLARWFAELPAPLQQAAAVLTAVSGALLMAGGGALLLVPKIVGVIDAMAGLKKAAPRLAAVMSKAFSVKALGVFGLAVAAVAATVTAFSARAEQARQRTEAWAAAMDSLGNVNVDAIWSKWQQQTGTGFFERTRDSIVNLTQALNISGTEVGRWIVDADAMNDALDGLRANYDVLSQAANDLGGRDFVSGEMQTELRLHADLIRSLEEAAEAREGAARAAEIEAAGLQYVRAEQEAATAAEREAQEAREATIRQVEAWREGMVSAASQFGGALDAFQAAGEAAAQGTRDAFRPPSMSAWIRHLEEQGQKLLEWRDNAIRAGEQVREELPEHMHAAGMAMVNELREAGPEGLAALRLFTQGSAEERERLVEAWSGTGAMIGEQVVADIERSDAPTITVEMDAGPAEVTLADFLSSIDSIDGEITFTGDARQPRRLLHDVVAEVDAATGEVTITAATGDAVATLRDVVTTVDEATGAVTISGKDEQGRQVVATFTSWADTQESTVRLGVDTSEATRAIASWVQRHGNIRIPVTLYQRGNMTPHVAMSRLPGRADGGRLPGVPPTNPGVDNLLGVNDSGVPIVRVRSREWVVNERASDHYGDGLMSAINSMAIPRETLAGLAGLASGGRIGSLSMDTLQAKRRDWMDDLQLARTYQRISRLQQSLRATGRERLTGIDRQVAELELAEARDQLHRAHAARRYGDAAAFDRAIEQQREAQRRREEQAREAQRRREEQARDVQRRREEQAREAQRRQDELRRQAEARAERADRLRLSASRGQIIGQATSGLSGAQSVADQLRSMASDSSLGLSAAQQRALNQAANNAESTFTRLFAQADGVADRLTEARDRVQELSQIRASAQSAIMSGFRLADALTEVTTRTETASGVGWFEEVQGPSGASALARAQAFAAQVQRFAGLLQRLRQAGFSGVVLQDIAAMGAEAGIPAAEALLELSSSDVRAMNAAFADIERWAGQAGQFVTEGFFSGGVAAAEGIVDGLLSEQARIDAAVTRVAQGMQDAMKRALGIRSPSRVFRKLLREVPRGAALGIEDGTPEVEKAAARMLAVPTVVDVPTIRVNASAESRAALSNPVKGEPQRLHPADLDYLADKLARAVKNGARDGGPVRSL